MLRLKPGCYVVAVSGGVDSVALLHMLATQKTHNQTRGYSFVVAHFDHGIRENSSIDRLFVAKLAATYKLPYRYAEGRLGYAANEATARTARYSFLRKIQDELPATSIITAHHQDDLLETAIINMLRGTGRRGLTTMLSNQRLTRPLLSTPKADVIKYAQTHNLVWREDSTNNDEHYLRNYVRRRMVKRFTPAARTQMLGYINALYQINSLIDVNLTNDLNEHIKDNGCDRQWFCQLSHTEAKETLAFWLRSSGLNSYDTATLERAVIMSKVCQPGALILLKKGYAMRVSAKTLALIGTER